MSLSFLLLRVDHWCQASIPHTLLRPLWRDWGNDPSPFPHNSFDAIHCQPISPIFFTKLENLCLRSFCLILKSTQWRENLGNAKISYLIGRDRGVYIVIASSISRIANAKSGLFNPAQTAQADTDE